MGKGLSPAGSLETGALWAAVALAAFTLPAIPGCSESGPAAPPTGLSGGQLAIERERLAEVRDLKNGVYVFPAEMFPETLSEFRQKHPELRIVGVTQGTDVTHGQSDWTWARAETFVVVTEDK